MWCDRGDHNDLQDAVTLIFRFDKLLRLFVWISRIHFHFGRQKISTQSGFHIAVIGGWKSSIAGRALQLASAR
jgi:hypothetical protein